MLRAEVEIALSARGIMGNCIYSNQRAPKKPAVVRDSESAQRAHTWISVHSSLSGPLKHTRTHTHTYITSAPALSKAVRSSQGPW